MGMGALFGKMAARPKLRVLCFGDSLTAGYSGLNAAGHPYSEQLKQTLAMAFPDLKIVTASDGVCGSKVTGEFLERMRKHFPAPSRWKKGHNEDEAKPPYDWVIVLGGTNDIGVGIEVDDIFATLREVWDIPLQHKCKVLALTVPEAGRIIEDFDARRNRLNSLIKGYERDGFHVFDLHEAVPYHSMSEANRRRYWYDHLHFTAQGYDLVGDKVGTALVRILKPPSRD